MSTALPSRPSRRPPVTHRARRWMLQYDPSTGIYGMDFYVVLTRRGARVSRRKRCQKKIGITHKVTRDDAIAWFQKKFDGVVLGSK